MKCCKARNLSRFWTALWLCPKICRHSEEKGSWPSEQEHVGTGWSTSSCALREWTCLIERLATTHLRGNVLQAFASHSLNFRKLYLQCTFNYTAEYMLASADMSSMLARYNKYHKLTSNYIEWLGWPCVKTAASQGRQPHGRTQVLYCLKMQR